MHIEFILKFFFKLFLNSWLLTIISSAKFNINLYKIFLKLLLDHPSGAVFDLDIIFTLKSFEKIIEYQFA